jgi:hypothetical protein
MNRFLQGLPVPAFQDVVRLNLIAIDGPWQVMDDHAIPTQKSRDECPK